MIIPLAHRSLHALHFGAVGGLLYSTVVGVIMLTVAAPLWLQHTSASGYSAFSSSSLWNQAVPRYTTSDASSGAVIAAAATGYGAQIGSSVGSPVYSVELAVPTVAVQYDDCDGSGLNGVFAADWAAVPIPFYAQSGTNGALTIYQPTTQTLWEFSGAQKIAGQWQACHGGKIAGIGSSDGVFANPYGAQASGLAYLAGQVTVAELQNRQIGHVMGLYLPQVGPGSIAPARSAGGSGSVSAGQRLQLDPSLDVASLGLNPAAATIAKAAQRYGFIVWGTASSVTVAAESPLSYTSHGAANPYSSLATSMVGFPWDKLRSLPAGYSQSVHVPYITAFTSSATAVNYNDAVQLSWTAGNVDECAVPGVASHAAAQGQTTTAPVRNDTVFTLNCSGPEGSVSRQITVTVQGGAGTNDPVPTVTQTTITPPLRGEAGIVPDLMAPGSRPVYKVAFYESDTLIHATTTTPFALNTRLLMDGEHLLRIHVFYSDGSDDYRTVSMHVRNQPAALGLASQIYSGKLVDAIPPALLTVIGMGIVGCMLGAAVLGWRWSHPDRLHLPHKRLVRYY